MSKGAESGVSTTAVENRAGNCAGAVSAGAGVLLRGAAVCCGRACAAAAADARFSRGEDVRQVHPHEHDRQEEHQGARVEQRGPRQGRVTAVEGQVPHRVIAADAAETPGGQVEPAFRAHPVGRQPNRRGRAVSLVHAARLFSFVAHPWQKFRPTVPLAPTDVFSTIQYRSVRAFPSEGSLIFRRPSAGSPSRPYTLFTCST